MRVILQRFRRRKIRKKIEFHGVNWGGKKKRKRRITANSLYRSPLHIRFSRQSVHALRHHALVSRSVHAEIYVPGIRTPAQTECSMNERGYATEGITIVAVPSLEFGQPKYWRNSSVKSDLFRFLKLRLGFSNVSTIISFRSKIIWNSDFDCRTVKWKFRWKFWLFDRRIIYQ